MAAAMDKAAQSADFKKYLADELAFADSYIPAAKAGPFLDEQLALIDAEHAEDLSGRVPDAAATLRLVLPHGLLLVASVLLYWAATGIQVEHRRGRIGPGAWPKAIIVVMGLLCAYEIATAPAAVRPRGERPRRGRAARAGCDARPRRRRPRSRRASSPPASGSCSPTCSRVPWLGFFVATAVFLAAFPWFGGLRRPRPRRRARRRREPRARGHLHARGLHLAAAGRGAVPGAVARAARGRSALS